MTALLTRPLGTDDTGFDLFCGFGGSSQGLHAAGLDVRGAANHLPLAVEVHALNFPNTEHFRADLSNPDAADYVDPEHLPPVTFMWASPSCKNHSRANSKKVYAKGPASLFDDGEPFDQAAFANSERSRVTMMCPLRYARKHRPSFVVVENVMEVTYWGPQQSATKKTGDGTTFKWWLREWDKLGYEYEILYLNSMFFAPCPQSRDRCYIVLWPKGNPKPDLDYRPPAMCTSDTCQGAMVEAIQVFKKATKTWMFPRWGKYKTQYTYQCPVCAERVDPVAWPAYTAINWANLGPTIAEARDMGIVRADSTIERIRRGLTKMRGGPALIIPAKSQWGVDRTVEEPFTTQTSMHEKTLVIGDAAIQSMRDGNEAHPLDGQFDTLAERADQTLVLDGIGAVPMRSTVSGIVVDGSHTHSDARYDGNRSRSMAEPMGTVDAQANLHGAFITSEYGNVAEAGYRSKPITDPIGSLTATRSHGLATFDVPEGIIIPVNGNDHERPGQTRFRGVQDPMFTVVASQDWGIAHTGDTPPPGDPDKMPFLIEFRGGGSVKAGQHPVTEPAHAVTAGGFHHGLISPAIVQALNGGPADTRPHTMDEQLPTVTAGGTTALYVMPWLEQWVADPVGVTKQMATIMTHARHSLASSPDLDYGPVTDAEIDRVRFRMLEPDPELRLAMAFGRDYHLAGNKTQMVAGLGNAVTPPVAQWIVEQCMKSLSGRPQAVLV